MKELEKLINLSNQLLEKIFKEKLPKSKELSLEEAVMLTIFNSIIEKAESILILYKNNHFSGTDVLLRSVFESKTILEFISERHTKDRANAYFLSTRLKNIEIAEIVTDPNKRDKILEFFSDKDIEKIKEYLTNNETIKGIREEFENLTSANKSDKWLKIGKLNSFKDLCDYMGAEIEYDLIYRILSQEAHGKEMSDYFEIDKDEFILTKKSSSELITVFTRYNLIKVSELIAKQYNLSKFYKNKLSVLGLQRIMNNRTIFK